MFNFDIDLEKNAWKQAVLDSTLKYNTGVYCLYGHDNELLYVGWTKSLKERVNTYIRNGHHNKKLFRSSQIKTIKCICKIDFFRATHPDCDDIEKYIIEKLNPIHNIKFNET